MLVNGSIKMVLRSITWTFGMSARRSGEPGVLGDRAPAPATGEKLPAPESASIRGIVPLPIGIQAGVTLESC